MAPFRQAQHRSSKPLKSILKSSTVSRPQEPELLFSTSKKDKRQIKHSQFVSKITKPTVSKPQRRRPNKKLVTTLNALADALPNVEGDEKSSSDRKLQQQANIIKRKSLKSRPGALKRRERIDKDERDRFARNMAQLAASKTSTEPTDLSTSVLAVPSTSERWAALRGFISQTLETRSDLPPMKNLKYNIKVSER